MNILSSIRSSKSFILTILSLSQFLALSMWFAPNAVFNQLASVYELRNTDLSLISIAVIAGFVIGSLISAFLNLPDIIKAPRLFFIAALLGAISNGLAIFASGFFSLILLRFLTGAFLAGIYPVGMKLTASHFQHNRGLAIGILLSALTAGSGLPFLFNLVGVPYWKVVIVSVSLLSVISGTIVLIFIEEGPYVGSSSTFSFSAVASIYRKKSVRLANYGYFGHMWELYAFWIWIPKFLELSYRNQHPAASDNEVVRFFSIGSFLVFFGGALANVAGGYYSDKIGRTKFNGIMLTFSGLSSLLIGFFFAQPILAMLIAIFWGITIIPDSPQYSAMVSELADKKLVGSALTMQAAIGFALAMISVQLIPVLQEMVGWERVFLVLAVGPLFGIYSMIKLRGHEDSLLLANGNR